MIDRRLPLIFVVNQVDSMAKADKKTKKTRLSNDLLFARQPIFDAKKKVYAFELLYRDNDPTQANFADGDKATSSLIVNYCGSILNEEEGAYVKIFINLTRKLLLSDYFFPLDPKRIVIEILEDVTVDKRFVNRIKELKQQGYQFALDDYSFCDRFDEIVPLVDYIKVELLNLPIEELTPKMQKFETEVLDKLPKRPIMLAEKVEDQEMYDLCEKLGFELFQGYFLERPMPVYGTKIDNNSETALQIVCQLQDPDVEIDDLSRSISTDAKLSYQILKIVNSPLCRLPKKVSSLHEAVVYLGLQQIKKWAMAMVLSGGSAQNKALFLLLLTRARSCEQIATKLGLEKPDAFFTVGLFSGIDAVMLADKAWLLKKLDLADDINQALLEYKGEKGKILKLTMELEHEQLENIMQLNEETQRIYYQAHEEAVTWAGQVFKRL